MSASQALLIVVGCSLMVTGWIVIVEALDRRQRNKIARLRRRVYQESLTRPRWDAVRTLPERDQGILTGVRKHGPITGAELARRVEGKEATAAFRRRLAVLEEQHLVSRDSKGAWRAS